jgi:hypothetical protein
VFSAVSRPSNPRRRSLFFNGLHAGILTRGAA